MTKKVKSVWEKRKEAKKRKYGMDRERRRKEDEVEGGNKKGKIKEKKEKCCCNRCQKNLQGGVRDFEGLTEKV